MVIDKEKLIEAIVNNPTKDCDKFSSWVFQNGYLNGSATRQNEIIDIINAQPKTDWIPCEDVLSMSESDFITHILSTICDYAKVNNYEITETVKAMGENLIALTEIANFDKWKEGVTDDE